VKVVGSIKFLLLQVVLVTAWATVNLNLLRGLKPFDPFPFGILALVVSADVKSATQKAQGFSKTTDMHKLATELEEELPGPYSTLLAFEEQSNRRSVWAIART
jgi:hypothetical protein